MFVDRSKPVRRSFEHSRHRSSNGTFFFTRIIRILAVKVQTRRSDYCRRYMYVCVRVCVCTYNICYYSSKHIRISFTITYTKRFVRRCNSLDCCYCCSSRKKTKKDVNHLERFFLSNEAKLVSRLFFRSTSGISRECTTISSISLSFSPFSTTRHACSNIIYIYIFIYKYIYIFFFHGAPHLFSKYL